MLCILSGPALHRPNAPADARHVSRLLLLHSLDVLLPLPGGDGLGMEMHSPSSTLPYLRRPL